MKEIPFSIPTIAGFEKTFSNEKITALDYLSWFKKQFDKQLMSFLDSKKVEAREVNQDLVPLVEEIIRFSKNGGKRVRPAFLYSSYVASGGQAFEAIHFASMSVELLHTFALIHDDIIDNSNLRRGELTTHKQMEKFHREKKLLGNSKDFGLHSSILIGDLAFSYAEEVLTTAPFPQERLRRARYFFDQMKTQVIFGEYLDVLGGYKKTLTEDEVLQILELKTAKYTVERPLHMGAMLAGASFEVLETLSRFGIPFGQAFQIQDDIVGTFSTEKEIGKPADSDIKEGKKTLLLVKAQEKADGKQRKILDAVVGNKEASREGVEKVKSIMESTGARIYCVQLAKELLKQSKEALQGAKLKSQGKDYLTSAADYLLERL